MQDKKIEPKKQGGRSLPIRIIFAGNAEVGKTSIINAFFKNYFITQKTRSADQHSITQDYVKKLLKQKNSIVPFTKYSVQLIDASGDKRLRPFIKKVFNHGDSFILVSAVNDRESFKDYDQWLQDLNIQKHIPVFFIGNKIDLYENEKYFGEKQLKKKHQEIGRHGDVFMTSAISVEYYDTVKLAIDQIIFQTIEEMYKYQRDRKSSIKLEKFNQQWQKKKNCCK